MKKIALFVAMAMFLGAAVAQTKEVKKENPKVGSYEKVSRGRIKTIYISNNT